MGWFSKKKGEEIKEVPKKLPELPRLPELPDLEEHDEPIHQLPSFPSNSIGDKFSRNTIKHAMTGKKDSEEDHDIDDFESEDDRFQRMQIPLKKPMTREFHPLERSRIPEGFEEAARKVRKAEPVFIRIDKFEESLKIFENAKRQISEIEKTLEEIKRVKEEEEGELESWENEIKKIKTQIENVDRDIFSKIE